MTIQSITTGPYSPRPLWSPGRRQPEARRVGRCEGYRHRGRTQWIDRRQVAQGGGADRGSFPGSPLPSVWDACQCKLGQIIADLDGIFIHTIVLPPDMPGEAYTIRDVTEHHDVLSPTLTVQAEPFPRKEAGRVNATKMMACLCRCRPMHPVLSREACRNPKHNLPLRKRPFPAPIPFPWSF